jgi:transcriptional regulator with XRE-family HTH domain
MGRQPDVTSEARDLVNERLRALRTARGWTQQQAADAVRAAVEDATGREPGLDQTWIGRLERGSIRWPGAEYRAALRSVYGVESDDQLGLIGARSTGEVPVALAPAPDRLEQLRRSLVGSVSDGALSGIILDDLEQTAQRYGLIARDRPAGLLLTDLAADLAEVQELLTRPRPLSSALRLTRVAAQMCGLMCLTLIKLDRRSDFRSWARVARTTARETGDPETISWVLAQEAYGHYYGDDLDEALAVAQGAQQAAGNTPGVGSVLAAALEGRVLALMGDRSGCERALRRAEDGLIGLPPDCVNDSAFGYDEGQLRFHQGNAYTHLGDTASAWQAQQRALELCSPTDFMDRAFTGLDRASCLVSDGDVSAGLAYAVEVVSDLDDQQRAGIISLRGRQLLEGLPTAERRALPAAAELQDRLMTPDQSEVDEQ